MARLTILLVRVSSLGDVLHNMPIVADILRHHPDAVIDWVVEEGYVSLVRLNPHVRRIIPWGLRRWRKSLGQASTRAEVKQFFSTLREEQYDYVFDTQGLLKTGIIMGAARIRKGGAKVGLANGSEGSGYEGVSRFFHTRSIRLDPRTHAVARGRLVAAAALGYQVDCAPDFGLPGPDTGERPAWMPEGDYAVFFHGTAREAKKWAPDNWVATAMGLGRRKAGSRSACRAPAQRPRAAEASDDGGGDAGAQCGAGHRRRYRPDPHRRRLPAPDGRDLLRFAEVEDRGQLVRAHRQPGRPGRAAVER